jgi:hypothetical protein
MAMVAIHIRINRSTFSTGASLDDLPVPRSMRISRGVMGKRSLAVWRVNGKGRAWSLPDLDKHRALA